ncbi:MAG: nucleotidyl transferase AbiEii/AbiGii toxin family protein [Candidatus Omnitrophica bacterium]|nr:nucleotidyl transferase AbiEii/AbiGii toxin family protein [Candidatus Omnitrophota bacterium]
MISKNIANLYARDSKVSLEIAERDILLTYALKLLEEKGWLDRMVFKGGTCLRKFYIGKLMRFSLDLDFTYAGKDKPDDLILELAELFNSEYHGIRFSVDTKDFYVKDDGLACGAVIRYSHLFHQSTFDLELSLREPILLGPVNKSLSKTSYGRYLEFAPPSVLCLNLLELQAEKIRASNQRLRARDVFDLGLLVGSPFNKEFLRLLVILKFWHVRGEFNPESWLNKLESNAYDWDDLKQLLRKDQKLDSKNLIKKCVQSYAFLKSLTSEEEKIRMDTKRHAEAHRVEEIVNGLKKTGMSFENFL